MMIWCLQNDSWMTWNFYQNDQDGRNRQRYQRYSRQLLSLQKLTWNNTRTPAFQAVSSFFETNWEVPSLVFENCRQFLWVKIPILKAVRTCESSGVIRGYGQAWNWLINYHPLEIINWFHWLTNALIALICFVINLDQALLPRGEGGGGATSIAVCYKTLTSGDKITK